MTWRLSGGGVAESGHPVDPADLEFLVVHRPRYNDWSWPKGKAELNEPLPVTAVREVEEETGETVVLGAPLTTQRYRLGSGQTKEVRYWVGTVTPDGPARRTRRPVESASRREIDEVRWESAVRVRNLLTRRGDRRLLSETIARARTGLLATSPIALLRHAKAVSRSAWAENGSASEATRPLSRVGVRQAIDLVDMLSAFGIEHVVSSPWTRCVSTVGPYAALAGLPVDLRDGLTEDAVSTDPAGGARVVSEVLASASQAVVLCAHRPTLPVLMGSLIEASPSRLLDAFPRQSPWLTTAELLVTHVARGVTAGHDGGVRPEGSAVTGVEHHTTYTKLVLPDARSAG